jgi:NAD(P)-dependent dehydrogenase (short-subunit alcohol dehydrogenase family)
MLRSVSGSTSSRGIAAVVGVGPRLGSAVARKFASEGYTVAILSRDLGINLHSAVVGDVLSRPFFIPPFLPDDDRGIWYCPPCTADKLSQLAEEIAQEAKAQVFALRVDCADARSVREAFEGVLSLGPVEVLVYNACEPPGDNDGDAVARPRPFLSISPDAFHRAIAVSAAGAFHCAQQVRTHTYLLLQIHQPQLRSGA